MAVAVSGAAGATPMDPIAWQTYDAFSGPGLNNTLWTVDHMDGALTTGAGGLTLTPNSLSGTGKNRVAIDSTLSVGQTGFLAVQVPFSIANEGVPASGGAEAFEIELDDYYGNNYSSILWGNANNFSSDGFVYNGTLFNSSSEANEEGTSQNTSVSAGRLGFIYNQNTVAMYYNDGTGWHQLGAATSTVGWAFPLSFSLRASINNSGSLTVVVPDVQYSETAPVPVSLSSGWNLISLPLQQLNTSIASVLSTIQGAYEVVWAYSNGAWKVYDPNDTAGSTLTTMQAGVGYWIKAAAKNTLYVSGSTPSSSIQLGSGWNLVGYNAACATPSAALSSVSSSLQVLWGYSSSWESYDPTNGAQPSTFKLCPGAGYWIDVNGTAKWTMP
jgi:hypothetical protein